MILVTGFEPFGGLKHNPSATLLERLPQGVGDHPLHKAILPVSSATLPQVLGKLLALRPTDGSGFPSRSGGRKTPPPSRVFGDKPPRFTGPQQMTGYIDRHSPTDCRFCRPRYPLLHEKATGRLITASVPATRKVFRKSCPCNLSLRPLTPRHKGQYALSLQNPSRQKKCTIGNSLGFKRSSICFFTMIS